MRLINLFKRKLGEKKHAGDLSFRQVSDLVIEQEIAPAGYAAAKPYQDKLFKVREDMKQVLIKAVSEQNLNHIGIIQRQYENYVGESLPNS